MINQGSPWYESASIKKKRNKYVRSQRVKLRFNCKLAVIENYGYDFAGSGADFGLAYN